MNYCRKFLVCLALLSFSSQVLASDLLDVYRRALNNDPTFQAAHGTYFANQELTPQAFSYLLPNIVATNEASRSSNNGDSNQIIAAGDQSYNQNIWGLALTQPVFNYQYWKQLSQAKATVKSAEATYNYAAQDLMIRVTEAYLAVLQAKDNLEYTQAQVRALKRQMDQAQERYKVGLDTMTTVYLAQASYDQMVSEAISNKNSLYIAFENLRTLTNRNYSSLAPLKSNDVPLIRPVPDNQKAWTDRALFQNYSLLSSKYAVEAARENIKIQQSGHYPTLDLEGGYSSTDNDASANANPTGENSVVSLNLTFPLFQGGLISSQTRQAEYEYETATANYQSVYLNTLVNAKTAFNTIIVSLSKIKADKRSILSAENSVKSTNAQFQVGTATMVDVLTAQQQLYQSQTQKATDQYAYMNTILQLKLAAGTLSVSDLEELNRWLDNSTKNAVYNNAQIT
jgi:outer membrane protein